VIFLEKCLKVLKCCTFQWVQRWHNCSAAASFTNCVMTLYLLKVHLQTFLSIPITQKCQLLSCDSLIANEQYINKIYFIQSNHWATFSILSVKTRQMQYSLFWVISQHLKLASYSLGGKGRRRRWVKLVLPGSLQALFQFLVCTVFSAEVSLYVQVFTFEPFDQFSWNLECTLFFWLQLSDIIFNFRQSVITHPLLKQG
jgi:hypothetical protein